MLTKILRRARGISISIRPVWGVRRNHICSTTLSILICSVDVSISPTYRLYLTAWSFEENGVKVSSEPIVWTYLHYFFSFVQNSFQQRMDNLGGGKERREVPAIFSVADPGFPRSGTTPKEGAPTYYLIIWPNFYRKQHENVKNWTWAPPWIHQCFCDKFCQVYQLSPTSPEIHRIF